MPEVIPTPYGDARLLVVDDSSINLLFLEKLLKHAGYHNITSTTQPHEGERLALEMDPDLSILDLHMPGMSGLELLERIRAQATGGYMPILMYTTDTSWDARRSALALGATDFLTKPGDPSEIALRVRNFLEMRSLHRQLQDQNALLETKVRQRTRRLEEAQLEIVHRLALAGDYRDDETGEHCHRVGDLSYRIALQYGLPQVEAELIRAAAPLHDIGKVAIPDAILRKPGRLTSEEYDEMKRHIQIGASILSGSRSDILRMAHVITLTHHERWDGTGYGMGLKGKTIPIAGRIVAIADVFDALTTERPYKKVWPVEEAIREIVRSSGSHFDPAVVAAFLRAIEEPALAA